MSTNPDRPILKRRLHPRLPRPQPGAKRCANCRDVKTVIHFGPHKGRSDGLNAYCRGCAGKRVRDLATQRPVEHMLRRVRTRARLTGIPCTISEADITIPKRCPVLGLTLKQHDQTGLRPNSPSLDRIDNDLGYVPGNIMVISMRANSLKRDMTIPELKAFTKFYGTLLK